MNIQKRIQEIGSQDLSIKDKLSLLVYELADHFKTDIFFCEIIGKRWSFVAGSDETVYGSWRLQVNDRWGIISTRELAEDKDIHLINDMIRGILSG